MSDYLRALGNAAKSLWDYRPWGHADQSDSERSQAHLRSFNGGQYNNNNGLYSFSRKRKADHLECYSLYGTTLSDPEVAPFPKYQRIIQEMSKQKQKRSVTSMCNGRLEKFCPTTEKLNDTGVAQIRNTGSAKHGLRANLAAQQVRGTSTASAYLLQSRQNHQKVQGLFDSLEPEDDEDKNQPQQSTSARSAWQPVKSSAVYKTPAVSMRSTRHSESNGFLTPFSSFPKTTMQPRLFSPSSRESYPSRLSAPTQFRKPELVNLAEEEEEELSIENQPKIFSSTPADHFKSPTVNRLFPSRLSFIGNGISSPSQSPPISAEKSQPKTEQVEDDDDLVIIAEKIITSKHSPFRTNSLELETRSSRFRDRSWLNESLGIFHDNRKFREDRIDYETKKLAVLKNKSMLTSDIEARIRNNLTLTDIIVLEEPEEASLPALTPAMTKMIDNWLLGRDNDALVVTASNIQITVGDIKTLRLGQWLNDNIINSYMDLISVRASKDTSLPKVHVFSTFFYPKYLKEGYSNILKRWTRKVDIFGVDLLIFPIHLGVHWCLAVADRRAKTLKFYDSLSGNNRRALEALLSYMADEHKERKKAELNTKEWKLTLESGIPVQDNGSDCGVFTCQFAEYLSRDAKLTFDAPKMPYFRRRMIHETVKQELLVRK